MNWGMLANQLADRGAEMLKGWVEHIRKLADGAESLEQLRDLILDAYGDLPTDDLAAVMQLGFAAAQAAGLHDAAVESGAAR